MINILKVKNWFHNTFCWHKWKYVYRPDNDWYMGEKIPGYRKQYKVCEKCNKVCEWFGFWKTLTPEENKIFFRHMQLSLKDRSANVKLFTTTLIWEDEIDEHLKKYNN